MDAMDNLDRETTPRPRRAVTCNAIHGASNGDDGGPTEDAMALCVTKMNALFSR